MESTRRHGRSDGPAGPDWKRSGRAVLVGLGLTVGALILATLLSIGPIVLGGTSVLALTATFVLSEAGYALTGWLYLRRWFEETVTIRIPTAREAAWIVGSAAVMLVIATAITYSATVLGVTLGRADQEFLTGSPEMVLVLAVLSLVVIGPAEEYLFRGVIQRRLARSMRTPTAVLVTAVLFVIPHAIGYLGGAAGVLLLSLVPFSLSLLMGYVYERFDNLAVPILAHGIYNATLFTTTYYTAF